MYIQCQPHAMGPSAFVTIKACNYPTSLAVLSYQGHRAQTTNSASLSATSDMIRVVHTYGHQGRAVVARAGFGIGGVGDRMAGDGIARPRLQRPSKGPYDSRIGTADGWRKSTTSPVGLGAAGRLLDRDLLDSSAGATSAVGCIYLLLASISAETPLAS